ncbi:cobalt ECF transporter T component CbiQ [Devriesea agamarum]|uniref:cobalt ECF transporter T component CbiQ n=1 Tax=Devriesea agamarum TaxID=472569 RepID=UPI0038B2999F
MYSFGLVIVTISVPVWPGTLIVFIVATCSAVLIAKVPWKLYARMVAAPAAFVAISVLTVGISIGAPPDMPKLWSWGWLSMTHQGLAMAGTLAGRGFSAMAALILFAATTPMTDVLTFLQRLRVPAPLIDIASLTYRLLFVLAEVTGRVREAQEQRLGYVGFRRSFHSLGLLLSSVLLRSWERAQRLEAGLACRGYDGELKVLTSPSPVSWRFVVGSVIVLGLVIAAAYTGRITW